RREWQRAAGHGLSLLAWEGQSETRTFAGLAPRDEFATVQAGVLLTDGKAEARAAGVAVAWRVGAPEPGGPPLLLPRAQTDTVVAHRDGDRVVAHGHDQPYRFAFTVVDRVGQQVAQDALDTTGVHFCAGFGLGQHQLDRCARGARQHPDLLTNAL